METLKEAELIVNARKLHDFYADGRAVTLFEEDFDFLTDKNRIGKHADGEFYLDGMKVKRGPKKEKAKQKRPPEMRIPQ